MKHKPLMLLLLTVFILGCGSAQQVVEQTSTPAFTETPTLTATPAATATPESTQTSTPDAAATLQAEEFSALVTNHFNAAFADTVYGEYHPLEDSVQNLARIGYFKWGTYDVDIRNFILRTHVRMSTANNPSKSTGCGIVFRTVGEFTESIFVQQNGDLYYGAGDTNFNSGYYGKFDNPAEFDMVLIVNEKTYQVYIDDKEALRGESIIDPSSGGIGFAVQSGSDEEFGSQCNFTDNDLWAIRGK